MVALVRCDNDCTGDRMMLGFAIWSLVGLIIVLIGRGAWKSKTPVGFFTGTKPPEVTDVKKYNHAVAILWFLYAGVYEILGLPFLFLQQNSLGFIPIIFGILIATLGLILGYVWIARKFRRP